MKKSINKFTKILLLIAMIFSDLMTPIKVLANEVVQAVPNKGDIGINGVISDSDSVTVSLGGLTNEGDVQVTKTLKPSKDKNDNIIDGRYTIEFNIKGKDIEDTEEVTKPVYVVVVFDRSGSMQNYCIGKVFGSDKDMGTAENCGAFGSFYTLYPKWKNSVAGAKSFASTLLTKIPEAQIALVTFASSTNETPARPFAASNLDNADFGTPDGGTNLHSGLVKAKELLSDESVPENANKYIVVISDGEPTYYLTDENDPDSYDGPGGSTSEDVLDATYGTATSIKNSGTEIFAVGYDLDEDSFDVTGYGELTAETILKNVASIDTAEDKKNNITHYLNADPAAIAAAFTNIATSISYTPAGTDATLSDNIGSKFKIVGKSGNTFTSEVISEITEAGTTISFEIEVDEKKVTSSDWYNTNEGFSLTYTDASGEEQTLTTSQNPQVYWTPNVYEYTVNYYKDSISGTPIASEKFEVTNGTVISSIDQDKYLNNNNLGTVGYEVNSASGLPATITDNSTVINVLYTMKKFSYDVNYYYDGDLDEELSNTVEDVPYGTVVNANSLYSVGEKEGYGLISGTSTSGDVVIDNNNIEINIYYTKNSYGYNVNYHFNGETGFSKNNSALFGSTIKAEDNYLSDSELEENNKEDYFISPVRPSNPGQITIGTNEDNNTINIYYVSTVVTNESIEKDTTTNKITSGDTPITYTVNYTSKVNNVNKNDIVRVVITDTLPLEIDESKSSLNGGIYNNANKTITWTFEKNMTEFTEEYDASKTITYTVVYKNVGNGDGGNLVNSVVGTTTAGGKTTQGISDSAIVQVEIPGKVVVHHYLDETTNSIADDQTLEGIVGQTYNANSNSIFGYTLNSDKLPTNAKGTYTEDTIYVTYYYTKNDGEITEDKTDVIKTSTDSDKLIDSVDSVFGYTINATSEVKDYVGNVTVTVVDTLPYDLTEEAINNLSNECEYDSASKTITCARVKTITEKDYTNGVYNVNETFTLELTFTEVTEEVVTNNAKVEIKLDSNVKDEDTDTEEVKVEKGKVVVTYKDTLGNELNKDITLEGLVGNEYKTEEKTFFGYTLTKKPNNANGVYTKEDITVNYVYSKNDGEITEDKTDVIKTSTDSDKVVDSVDGVFGYTINATGEVKDYVGDVTITVVDTLPYALTEEAINNLSNECEYDSTSKTITCKRVKTITEKDYTNGVYNVNETFTLELTFIEVTEEEVVNNVKSIITLDSNVKDEDTDTEEVTVSKGNVVVVYKDTLGNVFETINLSQELAGSEYTTEAKEYYGYSLTGDPDNKDGIYLANQTITVNYIYSKNPITISGNSVVKEGPTGGSVSDVEETFDYTIKYSATIKEYIGSAELKVVDTLPFGAVIVSMDNRCTYDGSRTITCTEGYTIDKDTTINETFNILLKYVDISFDNIETSTTLTNSVVAELTYGSDKVTNTDSEDTIIEVGTVVVTYKDTLGNILADSVSSKGLAGDDYTTQEKTFFGYTLTSVPNNANGEYVANQTITVNYVYSKNDGEIIEDKTDVIKMSTDSDKVVDSVEDVFSYTIEAKGEVKDYVGNVTITVVDTLPYALTEEAINNLSNECEYDSASKTITCTRVKTITEKDYTNGVYNVNETFTLELTFIEVTEEVVVNNAKVEIKLDSNVKDEDTDTEEVKVEKGKVVVTYKDTLGNELSKDITLEGLVGNEYKTQEKTFFGYTLTKKPNNANGVYTKEDITVNYVYSKNDGEITEDKTDVIKTSTDSDKLIDSVDSVFGYTIEAKGEVKDYVGDVTVTVVDTLPYALTEEAINNLSNECEYDSASKTITCKRVKTITEKDYTNGVYTIDETFTLELTFTEVTEEVVTNNAKVEIKLDSNVKDEDTDTEEVKVEKGNVIVTYEDTLGNELNKDITLEGLVGNSYTTDEKTFYGYTLTKTPDNANGKYIANQTITVNYIYSKNIGTSSEEFVKDGLKQISDINSAFNYNIKYNTTISDYVGEATLIITDELPYEIDIEKSIYNNENCQYTEGKLVCTYTKNITKDDNSFVIEENMSLYYLNITDSKVTNKANAVLTYGTTTKTNDSEYTSEVKTSTVTVNYVNKKGKKLADSIVLTGMVGYTYTTEKKVFDKYHFIEVTGEVEGTFVEENMEVTYVYDLTPLPPQTGVEFDNMFIFIKYLIVLAIIVIGDKTYKLIINN